MALLYIDYMITTAIYVILHWLIGDKRLHLIAFSTGGSFWNSFTTRRYFASNSRHWRLRVGVGSAQRGFWFRRRRLSSLHHGSTPTQRHFIIFGVVSSTPSLGGTASFLDQRLRWWRRCGISGGVGGGGPVEDNGLGGWGSDVESARDSFVCICSCAIGAGGEPLTQIVNK